jgi:hypothetical protein
MKVWSEKVRRVFSFFLASIGFWIGLGSLMAWQECLVERTQGLQVNIYEFVLVYELREDFTLALLTPPVFFLVRRFAIGLDKPLRGVIAYVLGFAPFLASYLSIRWILTLIWRAPLAKTVPSGSVLGLVPVTFAELMTAYTAIVIAAHAY